MPDKIGIKKLTVNLANSYRILKKSTKTVIHIFYFLRWIVEHIIILELLVILGLVSILFIKLSKEIEQVNISK